MSIREQASSCTVCSHPALATVIDFGAQPPSNRFIPEASCKHDQELHRLALGYCPHCGTAQLTQRMPIAAVRPRYTWLLYNEPEGHLDEASAELAKLPGINSESRILGITYKDQSTVDRLARLGLPLGRCIAEADFDSQTELFGLETVQQLLRNPKTISSIKAKYGVADIVVMRHIIEHAQDAAKLISSLRGLIADNGYLVMELPDSDKIFKAGNHAFIWEEHISYFTEESLGTLGQSVGASLAWFKRCPYSYEDSLLVAFRFQEARPSVKAENESFGKIEAELKKFRQDFEAAKQKWREQLLSHRKNGEKIAVFGAGHLAAKFINFLDLKDLIDCVIDDNTNKAGMRMPGSLLPIVPSKELAERGIKICVSTLSPESEIKVRQKLASYFDDGGQLIPAFMVAKELR